MLLLCMFSYYTSPTPIFPVSSVIAISSALLLPGRSRAEHSLQTWMVEICVHEAELGNNENPLVRAIFPSSYLGIWLYFSISFTGEALNAYKHNQMQCLLLAFVTNVELLK